MKFCWSTLTVKDLEESLKFYEEIVGLKIQQRFKGGPGMEIAFLGEGETKIELIYNSNVKEVNYGTDISLGFEVNSVDQMMELVKSKGIALHSGPFQPNPHIKFFFVLDPNGLKIQFVENM
ncbi:VOC family protein [Clostridium scatologenes]|uniref:Glyoxalase/bleomycin resistance protein/dioxygenase n=1 Tax=Clostridium scatologenes TaxID=1548 RepID=A0A0E3GQW8_CLOSL|nr:VOC family protein [Clostridium scatologenes]AKA69296.1 Glyoxalase/bleomycin resistance protein/dioxygenase [Clostridium scatologenes]